MLSVTLKENFPSVLSLLNLLEKDLFDLLCSTITKPDEAYNDSMGSTYFLKKHNNLYLNVVADEGGARKACLISLKTHTRMRPEKDGYDVSAIKLTWI